MGSLVSLGAGSVTGSASPRVFAISATTAGRWLLVGVSMYSGNNTVVTGVTAPDGSTTLTQLGSTANAFNYHISLWGVYTVGGFSAGDVSITFNNLLTDGICVAVTELDGADTSADPRDGGSSGTTGTIRNSGLTTAYTSGTVATSNASDLLVGLAFADGAESSTEGTNWTEINDVAFVGNDWIITTEYREVSSTGSYAATGTWNRAPSFGDTALIVAFKASSGTTWPPADTPPAPPLRVVRSNLRLG